MGVLTAKVPVDQARLGTAAAQTEHLTVVAVDSVPVTPAGTASCQDQLEEHAVAVRQLGRRVIVDIIEIGRRLSECRRICGHGNWLSWLKREFGWTEQTALNFIRAHELSESKNFLDLSLPVSAIYLLAAPGSPPEACDEIIERAKAGETLHVAEVKKVVERHKSNKGSRQPAATSRSNADDQNVGDARGDDRGDERANTLSAQPAQEPPNRRAVCRVAVGCSFRIRKPR